MQEVGSLRGVLTLDDREWTAALGDARTSMANFVQEMRNQFAQLEQTVRRIGVGLTAGVTLPFAGLVTTSVRGAGNFQQAMNRVNASMRNLNPQQLQEMGRLARDLGPQVGMGATQAASAIETLALAGMDASTIMNGGLRSALTLSAANLGDVAASGAMVQNVLQQFQLSASDLPMVVNRITGALDNSQFGFEDFRLGIAQAGTVASAAGVTFRDFTTALAATSSAFASGSDAGTSFKTYMNTLTPNSKEAAKAMRMLGISFFEATGKLKPFAEQAELLRQSTRDLADEARQRVFEEIFGADAARTAIALARTGREEFERMDAAIGGTDASEKLAIQMRGLNGAVGRLKAAFEELKIAIGETGLLDIVTGFVEGLAGLVRRIAEANPILLKFGVIVGGLASLLGPLVLLIGPAIHFMIWRLAAGFGLLGKAVQFLLFPIVTLIELFGGLAARLAIGAAFSAITGPIGIAVAAFMLFKREVIGALTSAWEVAKQALGPPLQLLFTNVGRVFSAIGALFSQIANGPIGAAIGAVISFLGELRDVIGAVLGNLLFNSLSLLINLLSTVIQAVGEMVGVIASLLSGDWEGAWNGAVSAVANFGQNIVDTLATAFPPLRDFFQAIHDILSAFVQTLAWVSGKIIEFAGAIVGVFWALVSPILSAVQSVYGAISEWLYERFGWVYDGVKGIAERIVALWNWVKEMLGAGPSINTDGFLGAAGSAVDALAGVRSAAQAAGGVRVTGGGRNPTFGGGSGGGRQRRGGRSNGEDLAAKREELRLQQELAVARAAENHDEVRRIERQLERNRLIKQYRDLNLNAAQATLAAERDMAALRAAESTTLARNLAIAEEERDLEAARLDDDHRYVARLERQRDLREQINRFLAMDVTETEARVRAEAWLNQVEEARAARRQREAQQDEASRQIDLARARGDTALARDLQRKDDIRRRAQELEARLVDPEAAREQAEREWTEQERARQTGNWRSVFRDGVVAAMNGDLKGWLKDRWTEIWSRALEDSINKVADLLRDLLSNLINKSGGGEKGGGIFGSILGGLGSLLGIGGGGFGAGKPGLGVSAPSIPGLLPKFAGGGAMQLGGFSGVDRNLLSLNGSPIAKVSQGETMEIKPANDAVGGQIRIEPSPYFNAIVDERAAQVAAPLAVRAEHAGAARARSQSVRSAMRRIPTG